MGIVIKKDKRVLQNKKLAPAIQYVLPNTKSVPVNFLGGYSMLIYGKKKIGKTSLASQFEDALFLFFEPGGKALRIYQERMNTWGKFKAFVKLICKDERFKTIVVDTADIAYELCLEHVCWDMGIDHPADAGYGKGWNAVKREFTSEFNKLLNSGKGVIFISHQKDEKIEERSGKTYDRKTSTLSGQAKEALEGVVDIWVNYDYDGKNRVLTILGDDYTDAGHRMEENFLYTNGNRVREVSMGKNPKEAYQNFVDAFQNKLTEAKGGNDLVVKKGTGKIILKKKQN